MFKIKYWIFIRVSIPIFQIRLDCSKLKGNGVRLTVSWHGKLVRSVWANPQMKVVHSVHTWPRRKPQSHPITITLGQAVEPRGKSRRNLKKETKTSTERARENDLRRRRRRRQMASRWDRWSPAERFLHASRSGNPNLCLFLEKRFCILIKP